MSLVIKILEISSVEEIKIRILSPFPTFFLFSHQLDTGPPSLSWKRISISFYILPMCFEKYATSASTGNSTPFYYYH